MIKYISLSLVFGVRSIITSISPIDNLLYIPWEFVSKKPSKALTDVCMVREEQQILHNTYEHLRTPSFHRGC